MNIAEKNIVKDFFENKQGSTKPLKSAATVKAYFDNNFPKIGKKLNIQTLEYWKTQKKKQLKGITSVSKKRGRQAFLPKELEEKIIQIVKELGEQGTPMNSTTIRPLIKSIIKNEGINFYI